MKKNKWITLITSLSLSTAIVLPVALLTSCSSVSNFTYKYDSSNKTITINSNFIGYDNIYYGYQAICSNVKEYNRWNQISKILYQNIPSLFLSPDIEIANVELNSWSIIININNNIDVSKIIINFPTFNLSKLSPDISNTFYIQSNTVFLNNSIEEISQMDSNTILNKIEELGNINIPKNCYIDKKLSYMTNEYINFYIFLPDFAQPFGLLKIYFEDIEIPYIKPTGPIENWTLENDWQSIINWNTTSIEGTTYKYIENIITDYIPTSNIISTYSSAISSEIVNNYFSVIYSDVYTNIINDLNYAAKNSLSQIFASWNLSNILDMNIYISNNIDVKNNNIYGEYVFQFCNPTDFSVKLNKSNFYWNLDFDEIEVPSMGRVTLRLKFNESSIAPYLTTESNINNTAYLTTSFDNIDIDLFLNNEKIYSIKNENNICISPNSYTLKTIVKNVKNGLSIIDANSILEKSYNTLKQEDILESNNIYVQNNILKFNIILKVVQNVLLLSAKNPTIYDFIISLNNDIYNLILSLTNNDYLARLLGNLFTNQKLSTFLFYNIDNIIGVLETLLPNSEAKNSLIEMLYDIKKSNPSPTDMQDWVANLVSLKPMLEKVLSDQLGWLLDIIGPLLENASNDPNLFDCILSLLPNIFNTLSIQDGNIGNIGKSLLNYFSNLINFANMYDPDCSDNQISIDQYKNIHVLDFIVYEFTEGNTNSLFDIIFSIVGNNNSTLNTISNIINAINFKINCKIRTSVKSSIFQTYNYEEKNLYDVIKWIINSFFLEVKLEDGTITDLHTAIIDNIQYTNVENNAEINLDNNLVSISSNWNFNLKQTITINTLPIAALISKENITIDLSSLNLPSSVSNIVNTLINNAIPVNIVISQNNSINSYFSTSNSNLFPIVNSKGEINWQYISNNTMMVDMSNILSDSNIRVSDQEKCYGSSFSLLKLLLSSFISTNAITNKITYISTVLSDPIILNNYDNSSFISGLYIKEKQTNDIILNEFANWVKNENNYVFNQNRYEINYDSLRLFINQYFLFSDLFGNNNFANYMVTVTSANYKVFNQTNSVTLNIVFPCPVLIIKPDNSCYLSNSYTLTVNL